MKSLFGEDLFANPIAQPMGGRICTKYTFPPFSILNTTDKRWQTRKKQWVKTGIKSELGRSSHITFQIGDMDEYRKLETIKKAQKRSAKNTPGGGSLSKKTVWKDYSSKKHNSKFDIKTQKALGVYSVYGDTALDRNTGGVTGTSIFDPVLTELMYKWFCPKGGQVIDPFAGGSVRGVIASLLGLRYYGCDLRKEQIEANKVNAVDVFSRHIPQSYVKVKISSKSLNQLFVKCNEKYIINNCKGRCCQGTDGIKVSIHKSEHLKFIKKGAVIENGFIVPDERKLCPFKTDSGLCSVHNDKPFGCRVSPFTLTKNNTLIVRNRYRLLKCYRRKDIKKIPVYKAHKESLLLLFGEKGVKRIIKRIKKKKDCVVKLDYQKYRILIDNDFSKNKKEFNALLPYDLKWVSGDSIKELNDFPLSDFILTCPPYGDLEIYSEDKRDLSNMTYKDFLNNYALIIKKSLNKLKDDRFCCFVVGDFRNKEGFYNGFVADTIKIFSKNGAYLYNEFILKNAIGSLPVRIQIQFDSYKKIGKQHQNILIFYKGNPKKIKEMEFNL